MNDNDTQQKLPDDHPMMIAWQAFIKTDTFNRARIWALDAKHTDGSLWCAFVAGWNGKD